LPGWFSWVYCKFPAKTSKKAVLKPFSSHLKDFQATGRIRGFMAVFRYFSLFFALDFAGFSGAFFELILYRI
jgi:hypothetical protein